MLLCRYLNVLDGNAKVVDPQDTAKRFKDAFVDMFNSVPTEPENLDDIKKPKKTRKFNAIKGKSKQVQTQLPLNMAPPKDDEKPQYVMED